ncbi:MAG: transporter [Holophagaceae bacterium]|nr:transporter [Holophagaceae bacterium]
MNTPLWTRNFLLLCLSNLLLFCSFYALLPTLPVLVVGPLKGNVGQVGLVIGITSILAVVTRLLSGYVFDTRGRKPIVLLALGGIALVLGGYSLVGTVALLVLCRALHGVVWGFAATGNLTMSTDVIPEARRGEGIGYFSLSNTLAMALAPAIGLWVMARWGFRPMCLGGLFLALGSMACIALVSYVEPPTRKKTGALKWSDFYEARVLSLSFQIFCMSFGYGGILSLIALHFKAFGSGSTGIYFTLYALTLLALRPLVGKFYDHRGPNALMGPGLLALFACYLLLYLAKGLPYLLVSAVLLGVGYSIIQPMVMAMALQRVEVQRRAAANSNLFTALDLGVAVGSILLGCLADRIGLRLTFLICALSNLLPALSFYSFDRIRARSMASTSSLIP